VGIEQHFLRWCSISFICKEFSLSRYALYRHAHALGLFTQRKHNVLAALEPIIEQSGQVTASASAVIAAIQLYQRLSREQEQLDKGQRSDSVELSDRILKEDREATAQNGSSPESLPGTMESTPGAGKEDIGEAQSPEHPTVQ
jgi:cell division protein ZapA (FtsZ GTPase activity inhibitor)